MDKLRTSRYHLQEHIKHEFLCFLFQDILMFTENNTKNHPGIPLLQSIPKVFLLYVYISITGLRAP